MTIKLAIGSPAYEGRIDANHGPMWLSLGQALVGAPQYLPVMFAHVSFYGIERARNRLVAEAMRTGADWLLMVDADTWVEDNLGLTTGAAILRMIDDAIHGGYSIVSAPVRRRSGSTGIAAFRRVNGESVDVEELTRELNDVDEVGGACMAIDLAAVARVGAHFAFTNVLSEDREFCRQMRSAGCKIAVDGRIKTGHTSRPFPLYSE